MASGILRMTDGARRVADLIGDPPRDVPQRPLWGLISFLAFQTLPAAAAPALPASPRAGPPGAAAASLLGLRVGRPWPRRGSASSPPAVMAGWRLEGRYGSLAEAAAHWPSPPARWPGRC